MTWVATGLAVTSALVSTYSAYTQAQTQKKVANRNAAIAEMQAQDAQKRGEKDAIAQRQKGNQLVGLQRAAFAAKGVDLNEGTAGAVIDDTNFFSLADQTTARNNAAKDSWNKRAQRDGYSMEADSINPGANAAAAGLAGAANVASKWYTYGGGGGGGGQDYSGAFAIQKTNRGSGD